MAFHYGRDVPAEALSFFGVVVVDPDRAGPDVARRFDKSHTRVVAKLSVTQADLPRKAAEAQALADRGYGGVLLVPAARPSMSPADLGGLVRAIRRDHADWSIFVQAEPEPATGIAGIAPTDGLTGLVAGPLFWGWDGATKRPAAVDDASRARRVEALRAFKARTGLPVIDVEVTPPGGRTQARALAVAVADLGFAPWVAPASLDRVGLGTLEPIPRRVLVVYDSAEERYLPFTVAHRMAALPLEYLGLAVDYLDVRGPLPSMPTGDRYAGIVTWFTDDDLPTPLRYEGWLDQQIDDGVRVAILGHLGFAPTAAFRTRLGLDRPAETVAGPVQLASVGPLMGFEAPVSPLARDVPPWFGSGLARQVELADSHGRRFSPVVKGAWGAAAFDPYVLEPGVDGRQRWIVNPFGFFAEALDLPAMPIPDPTTENGRRLLEIHIDGDGFPSRAELPGGELAGEVIRREFLARYRLPTTVSVIEGEIARTGLYPEQAPELERVARTIFALPNVEVASHSYSHPFDWLRAGGVAAGPNDENESGGDADRLAIPGYEYAVAREVDGSVAYIGRELVPAGKPVRAFLWSGTALPPEDAIARADALGLANLNGDDAEEPGDRPTLAQIPSFVRPVGEHLQVYAPAQNENVFTNLWHGPFYGYRRVIDYFQFTEAPRRLKAIGVYYHFYSGTKAASIRALHDVYRWVTAQATFPVWASEYVERVRGFQSARLARGLDGRWRLAGFGGLRTVRLPASLGWPDPERSRGVVGVSDGAAGRFVALDGRPEVELATAPSAAVGLMLAESNGEVASWASPPGGQTARFRIRAHVPAMVAVAGCDKPKVFEVHAPGAHLKRTNAGPHWITFPGPDTGEVDVVCR